MVILFALSAVLVGGFWFHAEFYKFGLPVLVIAGALIIVMMILAFRLAVSGRFQALLRPRKSFEFELEEIDKVRHGVKKVILRKPKDKRDVQPGNIVSAKLKGKDDVEICRLRIVGIDRKYLADFKEEDLEAMGISSKGELSEKWRKLGGRLDERVYGELVFFESLETERRG